MSLIACLSNIDILVNEILWRSDRFVWFVKRCVYEERFGAIRFLEPTQSFVDNDLAAVRFDEADGITVTHKVNRMLMRWCGVVLSRHPMIKTEVAGLWLFRVVELAVAVPFAGHTRLISTTFQQPRNRDFVLPHVDFLAVIGHRFSGFRDPIVNTGAIGTSPRQQSNSRRGTNGRRRIEIGEPDAARGQPVQVWRLDVWMSVAFQVTVTEIVAEDNDDIGTIIGNNRCKL